MYKIFCINKVIREKYKDMREVPPPSHKFWTFPYIQRNVFTMRSDWIISFF